MSKKKKVAGIMITVYEDSLDVYYKGDEKKILAVLIKVLVDMGRKIPLSDSGIHELIDYEMRPNHE